MIYTPKQRELMHIWQRKELKRINLLEGSVSSGKTWISLVLWAFWVKTMPEDKLYLMCAKSLTTLKRNCLLLLQDLVGERNFTFSASNKEGQLFGRKVLFEGANDVRSEAKIRGLTLQGAYCDELTQIPEDFFNMLLSRLRLPKAKLIATTNPDHPSHWLKANFIDKADNLDFLDIFFSLDDNTTLPQDYIDNVKKEYTGVYYERFILGLWVAAEGLIYKQFADDMLRDKRYLIATKPEVSRITIGVDFGGSSSAHTFVCTGTDRAYVHLYGLLSERIECKDASGYRIEIDPEKLGQLFCDFVDRVIMMYGVPDKVYCDSAEQTLILGLKATARKRGLGWLRIENALKTSINDRIRTTQRLMAQGRFYIMEHGCESLKNALQTAVWNPKNLTEDERLDDGTSDIDTLDAFEYTFERDISKFIKFE